MLDIEQWGILKVSDTCSNKSLQIRLKSAPSRQDKSSRTSTTACAYSQAKLQPPMENHSPRKFPDFPETVHLGNKYLLVGILTILAKKL